jgi:hypothetical protein
MGQFSGDERHKATSWAQAWETQVKPPAKVDVLRPVALHETDNLAISHSNVVVYLRPDGGSEERCAGSKPQPKVYAPIDTPPPAPPPRDRMRHSMGVALAALVCANAAALLTGWTPAPNRAQASVMSVEALIGDWRGDCRSGETGKPIKLSVAQNRAGYELRWSKYAYPLQMAGDGLGFHALRDGAKVGAVVFEGDTLHVKMDNFRCGWIAAARI